MDWVQGKRGFWLLSDEEMRAVRDMLRDVEFSSEQYWYSYPQWAKGGRGWIGSRQGGTYIMKMLMWYHHVHKPGSKEWRAKIIIPAVVNSAMKQSPISDAPPLPPKEADEQSSRSSEGVGGVAGASGKEGS